MHACTHQICICSIHTPEFTGIFGLVHILWVWHILRRVINIIYIKERLFISVDISVYLHNSHPHVWQTLNFEKMVYVALSIFSHGQGFQRMSSILECTCLYIKNGAQRLTLTISELLSLCQYETNMNGNSV